MKGVTNMIREASREAFKSYCWDKSLKTDLKLHNCLIYKENLVTRYINKYLRYILDLKVLSSFVSLYVDNEDHVTIFREELHISFQNIAEANLAKDVLKKHNIIAYTAVHSRTALVLVDQDSIRLLTAIENEYASDIQKNVEEIRL